MQTIDEIKTALMPCLKSYGISRCAVFGSFARGEQTEDSDVDLLFSIDRHMPLDQWLDMQESMSRTVGRPIDLMEFGSLSKRVEAEILKEAVRIL